MSDGTEPRPRAGGWRLPLQVIPGSRLARLILALNLATLAILLAGMFGLNEWRRGLVDARIQYLDAQAQLVASVLYEAGGTQGEPYPALNPILSAQFLRTDVIPEGQRARIFDIDGNRVADSYQVSDAVLVEALPPARPADAPPPPAPDPEVEDRRLTEARNALAAEVEAALTGAPQAGIRINELGDRVVSVSVPLRHVETVVGVLTLEANDFSEIVADQRRAMVPFAVVAFLVSLLTALMLYLLIVRPVLRLARAADQVRLQRAKAISLPDLERRKDEIGDLARALETMTAALSERMVAIERFAADVAHEIKNPLTSIRSAVETLGLVRNDADRERLMSVLRRDVFRADRLITDISNASRLDAELSRDPPRPVALDRLLADIAGVYDEAPQVRLAVSDEPFMVLGREGPLGQVFRNLIDNARSFSPPDGEVRLSLAREENAILACVEDDGPGIPEENLETVFQRFYTSRPQGAAFGANSGLGLSIVRQIVEAHGGDVHAENLRDAAGAVRGARFVVRLPAG
ncbi:ATP-binding protein [Brevundimonas sp.]|uniref:ATP-binding protein n=1 Tax=Brevundimonas sp. TaxID=1871086 RepID=UPI0025D644F5|nr:ATP-binding protein [Brevundimonas sp.]